jgi:hypothetical protein
MSRQILRNSMCKAYTVKAANRTFGTSSRYLLDPNALIFDPKVGGILCYNKYFHIGTHQRTMS